LNKVDMIPEEERAKRIKAFIKAYGWKGPVFEISALTGEGCQQLCYAIQKDLDAKRQERDEQKSMKRMCVFMAMMKTVIQK